MEMKALAYLAEDACLASGFSLDRQGQALYG